MFPALPENLSLVLNSLTELKYACNSTSVPSDTLLWAPQAPAFMGMHTHVIKKINEMEILELKTQENSWLDRHAQYQMEDTRKISLNLNIDQRKLYRWEQNDKVMETIRKIIEAHWDATEQTSNWVLQGKERKWMETIFKGFNKCQTFLR